MSIEGGGKYPPYNMHQARIPAREAPHPHIDETERLPFASGLLDQHVPWYVPVSWPDEKETGMPLYNRTMPPDHRRSAELTHDPARETAMRVYFTDTYGRWYSVLNAKGNNAHEPNTRYDSSLSPLWAIRGYMSDQYRLRCERTSRLFRENDIDAEWPVHMKRPTHLILPDQHTPASRKELIVYASMHQEQDSQYQEPNPEVVQEAFAQFEPITLVRAMKMSERIWDLPNLSEEEMHALVLTATKLHNFDIKRREKDGSYDPELHGAVIDTSIPTQDQVDQYILDVLPRRIGRNLGLMHKLGVAHHFLHPGNITLMGEIVDLDSPTGHAVLGFGQDATMKERVKDIRAFFAEGGQHVFFPLSDDADRPSFYTNFFDTYCKTRDLTPDAPEALFISNILELPCEAMLSYLGEEIEKQYFETAYKAVVDLHQNPDALVAKDRDDMIVVEVDSSYDTADILFDQFWQENNLDALCDDLNTSCPKTQYEPTDTEGFRTLMRTILKERYALTISRTIAKNVSQALDYLSQTTTP